jgi:DNA-directed RNA polymerase subunit RPC12/RpoP
MGDTYIKIVPQHVSQEEANAIAQKVIGYLTERKIISETKSDCTLGEEGYEPGENYKEVVADDYDLRGLTINGLELTIGIRTVFWSGDVEEIKCPECKASIIDLDWSQAIEEWTNDSGDDNIQCPGCGKDNSITDFIFEPELAFGQLGLTFWNWPAFTGEFLEELQTEMGKKAKVIYGKL